MGEARSALLIGISRYDNNADLKSLDGPRVDVQSMRAVLEDPAVGGYRVEALEDVDSATACGHLEDFLGSRSENETCLLYFSGHGFIDPTGALYLCTTNASFRRPESSTIPAYLIARLVDKCQSKRVVLVLDCCYAGNFSGFAKSANVVQPQFGGTGLGRVVLTAGTENQLAWDNGDKGSIFSRHIVEGLRSGAADTDGDGRITVQELYDYVYRKVVEERSNQRPGKTTYRESGPSFLIAESRTNRIEQIPAWLHHELGSVVAETRLNALKALEDLVLTRPKTRDLVLEILRTALEDDSVRVQRTAHELLIRLNNSGPVPLPMPPRVAAPAPAHTESAPPPERVTPTPEHITHGGEGKAEFSLKVEVVLWLICSAFGTLFLLVLPTNSDAFRNDLGGRPNAILFPCASIFLILYSSFIAVRYRAVANVAAIFKSIAWWAGMVALGIVSFMFLSGLGSDIEVFMFFLIGYVGVAGLVMVALRATYLTTIGLAVPVGAAWLFGLIVWPMNAGRERTLILYVVAAAFALAFGALARFRYLKAHGR